MSVNENPKCVLLFSGKRKVGKDFLTDVLVKILKSFTNVVVIKISAPIKSHFAEKYSLPLDDLMGSGEFKERYRTEMIKWSDVERLKDPGIFCRQAVELYQAKSAPVWIVSDIRRKTDIAWFKSTYGDLVKTIRIFANDLTREQRGFNFTDGVDNVVSECDLDGLEDWDWCIENSDESDGMIKLEGLVSYVQDLVKP